MHGTRGILVSDFDSTVTRHDFYNLVRERWPIPPEDDPWEQYVAGTITHFEALAQIFSRIRASEAELHAIADSMELDPAFAPSVRALQENGWEVIIASAGCAWYIDYLLARTGVSIKVYSNPGTFDPTDGLRMTLPVDSPFLDPSTGVDKLAITRDALQRSDLVAFAGDGRPDFAPSLLVPPERRFARGWLAGALEEKGEPFLPFPSWEIIARTLLC
jgi:2-hydroxy-3-keto-5-methylthiopentenyl-1-phosphate phosphatase